MLVQHLLIVDDDVDSHEHLTTLVTRFFPMLTITSVFDGEQALTAFHTHPPDLIITDFQMPIMNGLELVRTLRALPSAVPILMLSSEDEVESRALAAGATIFLPKPISVAALRQLVDELSTQ